jgi:hypothetical protein
MALFDNWYDYLNPLEYADYAAQKTGLKPPPPGEDPYFQKLAAAADTFGANYGADRAAAGETRALDMDTIARLQRAASGLEPSAAEALMRKATDQNASQALGLAATLGGSNPGMALRAGLDAHSRAGAAVAADTAALRAREMEAARQLLAQQTATAATRDANTAQGTGSQFAGTVGAPYGAVQRNDAANQALAGTLLQTGGNILASYLGKPTPTQPSDVSLKRNIQPNPAMADDFLAGLQPQSFEYKKPDVNKPGGQRLGVMAQDLPRADTMTGPDGKKWISADVIGDVLAGLGRVNQKVEAVRAPMGGTVAGGPRQYEAAMSYMTAPRNDVRNFARAQVGRPPDPSMPTDEELGIAHQMVPSGVITDFLRGIGVIGR